MHATSNDSTMNSKRKRPPNQCKDMGSVFAGPHILAIGPDDPEGGWEAMFKRRDPMLKATGLGVQVIVHGWEDDPRELAEIPEAVALLKRFIGCF
jgi:hypothetical protein